MIFRFYCCGTHFAEKWGNKNPSLFDVSSLKLNILNFTTYSSCDVASFPKFDLKTEGSSIPRAGSEDYTDINDKDDKANKNYIKLESGVPCL